MALEPHVDHEVAVVLLIVRGVEREHRAAHRAGRRHPGIWVDAHRLAVVRVGCSLIRVIAVSEESFSAFSSAALSVSFS